MSCIEEYDLTEFEFSDLISFIIDMYNTYNIINKRKYETGEEFIGIEELKSKVYIIAKEVKNRIIKIWKNDDICNNLKNGKHLPMDVIIFPEINEDILIHKIVYENAINETDINNKSCIFISHKRVKYAMDHEGIIHILS